MNENKVDNFLKLICPNCKTYVRYSKEEIYKGIKENNLLCKLCNNKISVKIE